MEVAAPHEKEISEGKMYGHLIVTDNDSQLQMNPSSDSSEVLLIGFKGVKNQIEEQGITHLFFVWKVSICHSNVRPLDVSD